MSLDILRKVRKEFDYRSYIERHFSVKYTPNGEMRVCCPNCADYKYKLYVNDSRKLFNCFKCDFSNKNSDVFDLVAAAENIPRGAAMRRLAREYAPTAASWDEIYAAARAAVLEVEEDDPRTYVDTTIKTIKSLPEHMQPLLDPTDSIERPFWEYLNRRGLTDADVRAMKIHYAAKRNLPLRVNSKYRGNLGGRFLIPVYGGDNELVSWVARTIYAEEPKYLNAPESDISKTFWPFIPSQTPRVVLVEGIFDALAVHNLGMSTYAVFGKKLSTMQIAQLKSWDVKEVVLFWDKRDALPEMKRALTTLKMHFNTLYVPSFDKWPSAQDAGDALCDPNLRATMQTMLQDELVLVDSWDYTRWLTHV